MSSLVLKGSVFDGEESYENGIVIVDQDKGVITDVGPEDSVDLPYDAKVMGGIGQTILPGFMDAHVHFFGAKVYDLITWVTTPEPLVVLRSLAHLRNLLSAGFTTVRDLGSKGGAYLSRASKEGIIEGPRVLSCAKSLGQTGGDDDPINLPLDIARELAYSYFCDGPWDCRKAVRKLVRDGADVVKVYAATGTTPESYASEGYRLKKQLTVEELKAIVDEAHRAGLKVAGHAIGEDSVANVVEAGVDSIEHGLGLTPELAERIKKKNISYVPTLSVFLASPDLVTFINNKDLPDKLGIRRHFTTDLELAKEFGLRVVAGSDFGGTEAHPHGQNYREIAGLAKYFGNKEALRSATSNAAECLGLPNSGYLRKGCEADIVLVRGDPVQNIEAIAPTNVSAVLKNGKIMAPSRDKLNQL